MKLETFLNRRTSVYVNSYGSAYLCMLRLTGRMRSMKKERRKGGRGEKKSLRPTYKADRRIKLSRAVKARARYLRSDWSAAVHLWRPSPPFPSSSTHPFFLVLSHCRRRSRWRRLIVGAHQMPRIQPVFLFPASSYTIPLFFFLELASSGFSPPFSLLFPSIRFYALLSASRMQPFALAFPPRRTDLPLLFLRGMTLG